MKDLSLTAVFKEVKEGGYLAYIAEISGVNTQGETLEEAQQNLVEAFDMMMECRREELKDGENIITTPFIPMFHSINEKAKAS